MLRVCYSETAGEQRWILCGRLAGAWVDELRSCWREARDRAPHAHAFIDLNDVTYIDAPGEELLREMQGAGAQFIVAGVENRHLVTSFYQNQRGEK
jgi:hypothetical protein